MNLRKCIFNWLSDKPWTKGGLIGGGNLGGGSTKGSGWVVIISSVEVTALAGKGGGNAEDVDVMRGGSGGGTMVESSVIK